MNNPIDYKIFPLGESAIVVELSKTISPEINDKIHTLVKDIEKRPFSGFIECVPAYSSLTIFYDLILAQKSHESMDSVFSFVKSFVENKIRKISRSDSRSSGEIEIAVRFDKEVALDLDLVAKTNNLSANEVINIFLSKTYRVFMIGFLPGFPYMGEVAEAIATPRKQTPRKSVPKGSVGIAGTQTGIYPNQSPGGWQIIGRTDEELFTPLNKKLTLLNSGDRVKFVRK